MDTALNLLIIEDSERDVALEVRTLKAAGYRVTYVVAETAAEMKAALLKRPFDIVLSDHGLPQFDAPGALAVLKQSGQDIPFIVVSGSIGEETAVALIRAGAHDYIMKDRLQRLVPAIQRELVGAESRRERRRLEKARRNERIMLARTEGIAHIGSWEWDIAADTVTWSDELFRIFQRDPREGAPSFGEHPAFYHPDDMVRLRQAVEAAVADGTSYELELRAIRKDGAIRFCMARGLTEVAPDGRVVRLFGSLQDINESKRAEELLRQSEIHYRELFEHMGSGVAVYETRNNGDDFFFKEYNAAAEILDKTSRGQVIGRSVIDVFSQVRNFGLFDVFRRVYQTGKAERYPVTFYKDEKISGWRENYVYKLPTGEIVAVFDDVTERMQAEEELKRTLGSLKKAVGATIQVLVSVVEARDPYTAGHQLRSANLACAIATEMGLAQEKIDGIQMAGSIHDIGKLSIPSEILTKPTKLTKIEFSLIKVHPEKGYEMLKDVESPWPLTEIVYQHHERMDGSGYPRGLKRDDILIEARIMAVADVVEAMASHRPYRPGLGIEAALEEIEKNKGTLYDHDVADACLRLFREKIFQLGESAF